METFITTEQDLSGHDKPLDPDVVLVHFKLVGVGPNTLSDCEHLGYKVIAKVKEQPGFFVVSRNGEGLRAAMHDLVDRFCDKQEGKDESESS